MADLKHSERKFEAFVIDDEKIIADDLAQLISERAGWTATAFTNVDDALAAVANFKINVCFLDIEMPGQNGLSVGRTLKDSYPDIQIVFVTAFPQYAVSAFRLEATDYLVKPVTRELVSEACQRIEQNDDTRKQIAFAEGLTTFTDTQPEKRNRLKIRADGRIDYLDPTTIVYAKASGNYVDIVTTNNKYFIRTRFSEIASTLAEHNLLRIHRSYIVNPTRVSSATASGNNITRLFMENGTELPVSENYGADIAAILTAIDLP